MKTTFLIINWVFVVIFALFTLSMYLMGGRAQVIPLIIIVLLLLPPLRNLLHDQIGKAIHPLVYVVSIAILLIVFTQLGKLNPATSIYKSPDVEARFMELYDERVSQWPVAYEDVTIDTSYGSIHIIASGPEDAPPMLLLHASGVGGWSWLYNVESLNKHYRTYAIDTLGDAGKSVLTDINNHPNDGQSQAKLLTDIVDALGYDSVIVVGASESGFAGTNFALYAPEYVEKLILLGPMGYAGTQQSVIRIMLASMFPIKPVQNHTKAWALGTSPLVEERCGEWFTLLMSGAMPKKAMPVAFTDEEKQSLDMPMLLVLGQRDALVGNPDNAKESVKDIANIQVKVIDAGHLMNVEKPDEVNALILDFLNP